MAGFSVSSQGFGQNVLLLTGPLEFTYVHNRCRGRSVNKFAVITGLWLTGFGMAIHSNFKSDALMADIGLR
jgi:hypothetical protein